MRRTLYWKRLLVVIAVALAGGGAVFAVHRYQVRAQHAVVRDRAERLAADPARRAEALDVYRRYLRLNPGDEAGFVRYAGLLFDAAKADPGFTLAAAAGVEECLRAFPNHPDERLRLVELYVGTAQFAKLQTAKAHAEMLLAVPDHKDRVRALELAAECEAGLKNPAGALAHLGAAIATGAAPVRVYQRALELHHADRSDRDRDAKVVRLLAELRSGRFARDPAARVAAARFEMVLKNVGPARADLDFAFAELGGDRDPDALMARAELELASVPGPEAAPAHYARAAAHLKRAFELDPANVAVGLMYAEMLAFQDQRAEGVAVLARAAAGLGAVNDQYLALVDRLIDLGDRAAAAPLVERLAAGDARPVVGAYFRGRLAVLARDWPAAVALLSEAAPGMAPVPAYHKRALVGLATCYAAMQNPDKQLEFCRAALRADPTFGPAAVGEAEALARAGRTDEAVRKYRVIVNEFRMYDFRPELVRLELFDVLAKPGELGARDWGRFEDALGPVALRAPEVHILHADALALRGRTDEAARVLDDWLAAHPNHPRAAAVWVARARAGGAGAAILDEAEKRVGDAVDLRLARAAVLAARAKPPAAPEFDALAAGADKFAKPERFRLLLGVGQAAARVADRGPDGPAAAALRASALAHLRAAADVFPEELSARAALLDQAVAARRPEVAERALAEVAAIEGPGGPVGALGRVAVRFPEVRQTADGAARTAALRELRALAARARELRPGWARVDVALGQIDEAEGLFDAALENYRAALDKGELQELVVRRAVELYRLKQQDDRAVGLLNQLAARVRLPDDLERYRAIRNILAAPVPTAERPTIDRIAPADGTDARLQLLRGALLAAVRDDAAALAAFRRAVELADRDPETWAALVAQLVRAGRPVDAKRAAAEAEKKLTAAAPDTPEGRAALHVALGGLSELTGDADAALKHFTAARAAAPLELNPTRQLVGYLQRAGRGAEAARLLEAAQAAPAGDVARWARRHLALTLAARPDAYLVRREALALVERNLADKPDDRDDLRARAVVRTIDPETRAEGVAELRRLADRGDLGPDEYHLLGKLAFDTGQFADAETYFKLAARPRPGVTPEHLAALVRVYVAVGRLDRAEAALERLKLTAPGGWEATREEVRVLAKRAALQEAAGDPGEAQKLLARAREAVRRFPGWDAPANVAARSGPLFEELGMAADAEAAYQKLLADGGDPAARGSAPHAALAVFYVRRREPEKAIALARKYEAGTPVLLTARVLSGAVRAKRPDPTTEAEVGRWLDAALRAAAGTPELESALTGCRAELYDAQGRYPEAVAEYERALAKGKSDLVTNNYAMLVALADPKKADAAAALMTDLIGVRGPNPVFLDTRAVAHLVASRPAEAQKDLELALVQSDRPAYRYHLALALDLDGRDDKRPLVARELQRAKELGLRAADLHPLEAKRYAELLQKYKFPVE